MPRIKDTRTQKQKIWDEVADHFSSRSVMLSAINTQLKKRGRETVTRQAIDKWRSTGIPPINVIAVELATKGKIKREQIRPELYE